MKVSGGHRYLSTSPPLFLRGPPSFRCAPSKVYLAASSTRVNLSGIDDLLRMELLGFKVGCNLTKSASPHATISHDEIVDFGSLQ